jgi:hypothetical protein
MLTAVLPLALTPRAPAQVPVATAFTTTGAAAAYTHNNVGLRWAMETSSFYLRAAGSLGSSTRCPRRPGPQGLWPVANFALAGALAKLITVALYTFCTQFVGQVRSGITSAVEAD